MGKILLLAINAKYIHSSLSVWLISAGISKSFKDDFDVKIIEATINQKIPDIIEPVVDFKPDIIGISSYIWNAGILIDLLKQLHLELPEVVIVMGGPEASNNRDFWINNGADFVLDGEGEYIFPEFLGEFFDKKPDLNFGYVNPYSDDYFSSLNNKLAYIETSRGCPFACTFCLSADTKVKYFPMELVKENILKLSKANAKTIKFVDRTFNYNKKYANEIFIFIIRLDTQCCFHFEVAADLFDENMLDILKNAPCGRIQFEIGLQSFYKPALEASSRKMDLIKAEKNIRTLINYRNIHIHIDLIAGLPYETLNDFIKSFNRAYFLKTHNLQLGFLKLLYGSRLREQADVLGISYSKNPPYEILNSLWLSFDDICVLKQTENALQHTRNKGRFISTLDYVLSSTGKSPFELLCLLGNNVPNNGLQLEDYILLIFDFFVRLDNVDSNILKDCLIFDWLCMVKGKNTPQFLKNENLRRDIASKLIEKKLRFKIRREEYAILSTGKCIFVDRNTYDPITGLYKVFELEGF